MARSTDSPRSTQENRAEPGSSCGQQRAMQASRPWQAAGRAGPGGLWVGSWLPLSLSPPFFCSERDSVVALLLTHTWASAGGTLACTARQNHVAPLAHRSGLSLNHNVYLYLGCSLQPFCPFWEAPGGTEPLRDPLEILQYRPASLGLHAPIPVTTGLWMPAAYPQSMMPSITNASYHQRPSCGAKLPHREGHVGPPILFSSS